MGQHADTSENGWRNHGDLRPHTGAGHRLCHRSQRSCCVPGLALLLSGHRTHSMLWWRRRRCSRSGWPGTEQQNPEGFAAQHNLGSLPLGAGGSGPPCGGGMLQEADGTQGMSVCSGVGTGTCVSHKGSWWSWWRQMGTFRGCVGQVGSCLLLSRELFVCAGHLLLCFSLSGSTGPCGLGQTSLQVRHPSGEPDPTLELHGCCGACSPVPSSPWSWGRRRSAP